MNRRILGAVFGMLVVGAAAETPKELDLERQTPVAADSPIPITDFFRPVYMVSPTINRAGTHIGALVSGGGHRFQLMIIDREKGEHRVVSGRRDMDIIEPRWLSNDRIAYRLITDKLYEVGLMAVQLGKLRRSYPVYQYAGARIIGVPYDRPLNPVAWIRSDGSGRTVGMVELDTRRKGGAFIDLYDDRFADWTVIHETNLKAIKKTYPEPGPGLVVSYLADHNQELAFAFTVESGVPRAHYWTGEGWSTSSLDLDEWDVEAVGNRPHEIVLREERSGDEPGALHFADVATGEIGQFIFRDSQYDFEGWMFRDPKSRKLVGAMYDQAGPRNVWFDEGYASLQKSLDASFPGQVVRVMEGSTDGTVFLVRVASDRHPRAYYVIDLAKQSLDLVAESRPWLDPERMQRRRIMKFQTAEGRELDAYFTLPAGASKENPAPLVVLPHGGPWVRDTWSFDAEAQFLASRGYAVLQPNYRGSPGYDWMFPFEDRWDFLKMHDDVTRAARTLIATGYVDGDRVAIAGGSFGGYLALMGAVHEPELYRCAVTFAGVFDWEEVIKMESRMKHTNTDYQVLLRHMGDPKELSEWFEQISPGRRVDQIKMPVFVAHGKEDTVVSVGESRRLISDLKRHGVAHEALILGGEGHGTYKIENSVKYHGEMERFLRKHLQPVE